jgi:hypothetical protein
MGTTQNFDIPYPEPTDFVAQGAAAIQAVAEATDAIAQDLFLTQIGKQVVANTFVFLEDIGTLIRIAGGNILSVANRDAPGVEDYPIGARVDVIQTAGAGTATIGFSSGVTVNSKDGNLKLAGPFSAATLIYEGSNVWFLIGDLVP